MLGKSTPDTSDEGHSGSNPLSGDPQIERSNWLPFYRPYSFASQPFDCFAEDIQFSGIFLIGKNCMRMKKSAVFAFHPAKTAPRNSKWSLKDYHLREAAGCHFTGPIALRHSLSTALPRIFSFPELFCSFLFRGYLTILPQRCQALPENVFQFFQVLSAPRQHLFLFLYSRGHRAAVPCRICPCKRHSYPNFSGAIAFKKIKSARFSDDLFRFVKGFHLYFCFFETFSRVFYCKSVSKAL